MAGCCGNKRSSVNYEVTFRDGSTRVVETMPEARILVGQDTSVDPSGKRREPTLKAVPKAAG